MEVRLSQRLLKVIAEHKVNMLSARGLLELSIVTIEATRAYKIECGSHDKAIIASMNVTILELSGNR